MNHQRRKKIQKLIEKIEEAKTDLEAIKEDEQDAYDNMPESLQDGERGQKMSEGIDTLDTACDDLESTANNLLEVIES